MIRKLQPIIPRAALLTIYKSFLRPHLDYGDVIYDRAFNESFQNKLESVQYNAALAITGAIRGSSREKLYQELGLESLKSRRWYRKLCLFFKLKKNKHPSYLFDMIPKVLSTRTTRNHNNIPLFNVKHEYFRNSFFPSTVIEWNKFDNNIRNLESVSSFKKQILKFIRSSPNSTLNVHNHHGIKLLTRLRVGLSYLREHKFRHNFQDSLDPFCNCGRHIETTIHCFLHCSNYSNQRKTLFETFFIEPKWFNYSRNSPFWIELPQLRRKCMDNRINNRIYYNHGKVITPLLWIHLSKSPLLLKSLIDSGSPYVIPFCLVVKFFYTYFIFNALLNVYHQGYVVCNLFFLIFFIFFIVYIIFIEKKKKTLRFLIRQHQHFN